MEIDKIISLLFLFSQHLPTIHLQFQEREKTVETGERRDVTLLKISILPQSGDVLMLHFISYIEDLSRLIPWLGCLMPIFN